MAARLANALAAETAEQELLAPSKAWSSPLFFSAESMAERLANALAAETAEQESVSPSKAWSSPLFFSAESMAARLAASREEAVRKPLSAPITEEFVLQLVDALTTRGALPTRAGVLTLLEGEHELLRTLTRVFQSAT